MQSGLARPYKKPTQQKSKSLPKKQTKRKVVKRKVNRKVKKIRKSPAFKNLF